MKTASEDGVKLRVCFSVRGVVVDDDFIVVEVEKILIKGSCGKFGFDFGEPHVGFVRIHEVCD